MISYNIFFHCIYSCLVMRKFELSIHCFCIIAPLFDGIFYSFGIIAKFVHDFFKLRSINIVFTLGEFAILCGKICIVW